jgi:hypothetical protein
MAELPRFEGEEHQNVYTKMNRESEFTQEYKEKAVEMAPPPSAHLRLILREQKLFPPRKNPTGST